MTRHTTMEPLTLILALRETDPYVHTIFMQGGCYRLFLLLRKFWPSAIPVTNQDTNHIATLIDGVPYDINGIVQWTYREMDADEIQDAETWSFADHTYLQIGECPTCGEPLLALPVGSSQRQTERSKTVRKVAR